MPVLSGDSIPHIYFRRNVMFRSCVFRSVQIKRNSSHKKKVLCGNQKYAKIQCYGQWARNIDFFNSEVPDINDNGFQQYNFKWRVGSKKIPCTPLYNWNDATEKIRNSKISHFENGGTVSQVEGCLDFKSEDDQNPCSFRSINSSHHLDITDIYKSSNSCDVLNLTTLDDSKEIFAIPSDDNPLPQANKTDDGSGKIPLANNSQTETCSSVQNSQTETCSSVQNSQTETCSSIQNSQTETCSSMQNSQEPLDNQSILYKQSIRDKICAFHDRVLIVDNVSLARQIVKKLTTEYENYVYACDTEVANIDVKRETPVGHGEIICFSIYSKPKLDLGDGKCCIWVDVLDGGSDILKEFAPFFENSSIKKVWHNYSFDAHILENYGIKLSGFHADTIHMARLWNPSRLMIEGGYSLEALTNDEKIFSTFNGYDPIYNELGLTGKVGMKVLFGEQKMKKNGMPGKAIVLPPVKELQLNDRKHWICYSALDTVNTLLLYRFLKDCLSRIISSGKRSMFDFYEEYWKPFGNLLVEMETEGMLVDRGYLSQIETVATADKKACVDRFRNWASEHCPDAKYMNVRSDSQIRVLFFGGTANCKGDVLPVEKTFKIPNVDEPLEDNSKKIGSKFRTITLKCIVEGLKSPQHTNSGWPSVASDALMALCGKVSADSAASNCLESPETDVEEVDETMYGTAYAAFGKGKAGVRACHAISSLCEISTIDSLISNFIIPLQGSHIIGKTGRIHCSLNINTETGRLSARNPNLQNQPALEKDRYKIRQAFIAAPGKSLVVADYGQLELRLLAHLANCKSMLQAFKAGGDFHSRTALNMYSYIRDAVDKGEVIMEWDSSLGCDKPPVPLLKDAFASERRKAKMLNFSIAYGKTPRGLARDWKVSYEEALKTVELWYNDRKEVLKWQEARKKEVDEKKAVETLLGRHRFFPSDFPQYSYQKCHIYRSAINSPVQGSAADVAMCAMLQLSRNTTLKELGWKLVLQVHDEVILEGPSESSETAKATVIECMTKPFDGRNILRVDLSVDAKCAQNWYSAK